MLMPFSLQNGTISRFGPEVEQMVSDLVGDDREYLEAIGHLLWVEVANSAVPDLALAFEFCESLHRLGHLVATHRASESGIGQGSPCPAS